MTKDSRLRLRAYNLAGLAALLDLAKRLELTDVGYERVQDAIQECLTKICLVYGDPRLLKLVPSFHGKQEHTSEEVKEDGNSESD